MNSPLIPEALRDIVESAETSDFEAVIEAASPSGIMPDRVTELIPGVMRIQSLERVLNPNGQIRNRAVLYHDRCLLCVDWISLLIAGGLLHDTAKADEYRYDRIRSAFRLSDRGHLVGHRDTLIDWIAVARQTGRLSMPDDLYLALLRMINAVKGAPVWLGLREARCLEAEILSMADRLSGDEDVHVRCAPADDHASFGAYNAHMGRRSYVTEKEMS